MLTNLIDRLLSVLDLYELPDDAELLGATINEGEEF
jgi:hypothetical protein